MSTTYSSKIGKILNKIVENATLSNPAGIIQPYAGATIPSGWLECNGQAVSRTTYAKLFAAIGTTYGSGDGSTTFNVPNLMGKVVAGVSSSDTDFDLADTGGSKTISYTPSGSNSGGSVGYHTLTTSEMPSHRHTNYSGFDNSSSGLFAATTSSGYAGTHISGSYDPQTTEYTGGGGSHNHEFTNPTFSGTTATLNNLQPYMALKYIIWGGRASAQ